MVFSLSSLELPVFLYFLSHLGGHESWWTSTSSNDGCSTAADVLRLGQVKEIGSQIAAMGVAPCSEADAHGTVRDLGLPGIFVGDVIIIRWFCVLRNDTLLGSQAEQFVNLVNENPSVVIKESNQIFAARTFARQTQSETVPVVLDDAGPFEMVGGWEVRFRWWKKLRLL